ncbi:hypothetical protein Syun_014010 [Stephania yunnanensis]|uniref:Uncharacterized protein n=1 Tax=Stephania yunnanensis TaxID=152371 RepID=A0AAP0PBD7_9MAGN
MRRDKLNDRYRFWQFQLDSMFLTSRISNFPKLNDLGSSNCAHFGTKKAS